MLHRAGLRLVSWTRRGFDAVEKDPAAVARRLLPASPPGTSSSSTTAHALRQRRQPGRPRSPPPRARRPGGAGAAVRAPREDRSRRWERRHWASNQKWRKERAPAGRLRELLYKLRTEGGSPEHLAGAVALGVFIGCTPFYGLHLLLCIVFARLLRLNRALTYLAAHVSLPGVWPLLVLAELELGRRLRGAGYLPIHLAELRQLELRQFGVDLAARERWWSGAVLAAAFGLFALWAARRRQPHPERRGPASRRRPAATSTPACSTGSSCAASSATTRSTSTSSAGASSPPKAASSTSAAAGGSSSPSSSTARELPERGEYPEDWAPPPPASASTASKSRPKDAEAARHALGDRGRDRDRRPARPPGFPPADAILLLDVLHYLPAADQEDLSPGPPRPSRPGGVLLIRDADAGAGWRFTATRLQERFCALARRHWKQRFHYRSAAEWRALLEKLGLETDEEPMGMGTPYGNVLIAARKS